MMFNIGSSMSSDADGSSLALNLQGSQRTRRPIPSQHRIALSSSSQFECFRKDSEGPSCIPLNCIHNFGFP